MPLSPLTTPRVVPPAPSSASATTASSSGHSFSATPVLQRRCACGGTPGPDGECAECKRRRLQRAGAGVGPSFAPPIVHEVLRSPGRLLEPGVRGEMEARFGHDFSRVRVHTDARAAASARAVDAAAYTVGRDVVFGAGGYSPSSLPGRSLLAHELTHVVQQAGSPPPSRDLQVQPADHPSEGEAEHGRPGAGGHGPSVQRACLKPAECTSQEGSLTQFVRESEDQPEVKARRARRTAACTGPTAGSACTADGHGSPAPQLEAFLRSNNEARLKLITGIYIDKDIPANWGAYTTPCGNFMPPIAAGGYCTFVPDWLESQSAVYNTTRANTIGRRDRAEWRTMALETLTHETEHARFLTAPAITGAPCDLSAFQWDLSELAALTAGFVVVHRRSLRKQLAARRADRDRYLDWVVPIRPRSETIAGIVRLIRCHCDCGDADFFIRRTVEFATAGWNRYEQRIFHSALLDSKWDRFGLHWPIAPPETVDVRDLPSEIPTTDPEDLPFATSR